MTTDVKSCLQRATLASAALAMNSADCRFLPVVDPAGRPVGVITDGDICLLGATDHRPLRDIFVHEVMNRPVATCGPDADVLEVLGTMRSQRIRHVPVVGADGVLVGIVSLTDLVLCAEERGDRCSDPFCREIAATVREIAQKNPGGRSVRIHPFIER
jgi:CBS domain-containing protein